MTLKELNELRDMYFHIRRLRRRIAEIESAAYPQSVNTDKIVSSGNLPTSKTERVIERAEPHKAELMRLKEDYERRVSAVESEIYALDDEFIKAVLLSRFVDGNSWRRVAREIGGNNTEDSVKKACYRFFDRT